MAAAANPLRYEGVLTALRVERAEDGDRGHASLSTRSLPLTERDVLELAGKFGERPLEGQPL